MRRQRTEDQRCHWRGLFSRGLGRSSLRLGRGVVAWRRVTEWRGGMVTRLPLTELWGDAGPVVFVVAHVAAPLWRVPASGCLGFRRGEVRARVAGPEDFPGGYCHCASEWAVGEGPPVVLPSVAH